MSFESNCFSVLKIICTLLSLSHIVHSKASTLRLFKTSSSDYVEYPLDNVVPILSTDYYNANLPKFVIYTSGFSARADSDKVLSVIQKYLNRNDRLVGQLQWDDQANTYLNFILDPLNIQGILINYPVVVAASKKVGEEFGKALCALYKAGVDLNKIHLVGHSLGAHVIGSACRTLKDCTGGQSVNRTTGLDPASYGYQEPVPAVEPIGADCAEFVDILHTDPNRFGNKNNLGHVDFWVNVEYYSNHHYQPGCQDSLSAFCSHGVAVELWKEAIDDPNILVAVGEQNKVTYVGDNTDRSARGVYTFCTNNGPPYAKGVDGTDPAKCLK